MRWTTFQISASVLLALFVILDMCSDQCFIVIPKYFTDEPCFIVFDSMW